MAFDAAATVIGEKGTAGHAGLVASLGLICTERQGTLANGKSPGKGGKERQHSTLALACPHGPS